MDARVKPAHDRVRCVIANNTTGKKPWREFSISPALRRAAACSAV
jgi:hypothetical protein